MNESKIVCYSNGIPFDHRALIDLQINGKGYEIGLHKLSDLPFLKRSPANIYREILSKKLSYPDISKSKHFGEIG